MSLQRQRENSAAWISKDEVDFVATFDRNKRGFRRFESARLHKVCWIWHLDR